MVTVAAVARSLEPVPAASPGWSTIAAPDDEATRTPAGSTTNHDPPPPPARVTVTLAPSLDD